MNAPFRFAPCPVLAIVGRDPELADWGNPRGEILGEVVTLVAENELGYRFQFQDAFRSADEAWMFARTLFDLDVTSSPDFFPIDPAYGSVAYQRENVEFERAWEEERQEAFA